MKRIPSLIVKWLALTLAGSGMLAISLQAQSDSAVTASIPFPFTVGTQSIAPGTYEFSLVSSQFLLSVRNVRNGHQEFFIVHPEQENALHPRGRVVFQKSEDARRLDEIHFPGADSFAQLTLSQHPTAIEAATSSPGDTVSVAQR